MVNFFDLSVQYSKIACELEPTVLRILRSTKYILGEETENFERNLAQYCGTLYAAGVANGTDALVISLKAAGVMPGDEVITSPFTFFATAEAISQLNAIPVFADIDERTYCLDSSAIEEKITERTKAIIPVHIFGQVCEMDEINAIARKHGIIVIEDACQAVGAEYKGGKAGSLGDIGCFSFYPTKNLSCAGDGGAIITHNEELYKKIKLLRNHGSSVRYINETIGWNSRLDELQAAVLNIKFNYLNTWNSRRTCIASTYNNAFTGMKDVKAPYSSVNSKHVYHQYSILVNNRDGLKSFLDSKGIGACIFYPRALYSQSPYRMYNNPMDFPCTENVVKSIISLPMYPELSADSQSEVIESVREYYG